MFKFKLLVVIVLTVLISCAKKEAATETNSQANDLSENIDSSGSIESLVERIKMLNSIPPNRAEGEAANKSFENVIWWGAGRLPGFDYNEPPRGKPRGILSVVLV